MNEGQPPSSGQGGARPTTPVALQAVASDGVPSAGRVAAILALATAGAVAATMLMTAPDYPLALRADVTAMQQTPQWVAWVLILAIQTATWLALIVPAAGMLLRSRSALSWFGAFHVLMIAILLALPFLMASAFPVTHRVQLAFRPRLSLLTAVGSFLGLFVAAGVVRTDKEVDELAARAQSPTETDVAEYLELRRRLLFLGGVLALSVALAVIASGGMRNTIVAMESARATAETVAAETTTDDAKIEHLRNAAAAAARANRFGVELVWSYGLYYSFVLVLVYAPAYLSLIAAGRLIRDRLHPPLLPGHADYEARKKVRDATDEVLQLQTGAGQSLKAATLILIPLISSFASTLLGGVQVGG